MANKRYTVQALLSSARFSKYQQDFLKAILQKPDYTLAEAEKTVQAFFKTKE